jgi:hypothetical protein
MPRRRMYRISPELYISHRKGILGELIREGLNRGILELDEKAQPKFVGSSENIWEEIRCEPWPDDAACIDAAINRIADRLGIIVEYEFK